jgi:hypothetical protein
MRKRKGKDASLLLHYLFFLRAIRSARVSPASATAEYYFEMLRCLATRQRSKAGG